MDGDNFDHREHLLDAEQICMLYSSPFLEIPRANFPAGQIYFTSANLRDSCPSGKSGSRCFAEDGETVPDLSGIRYGWR